MPLPHGLLQNIIIGAQLQGFRLLFVVRRDSVVVGSLHLLLPYCVEAKCLEVIHVDIYFLKINQFSIPLKISSRSGCVDKLGVFHANQTSMCLDPHLN